MIKNKGFVGIGLIVAIVLGAVVVGGGAYYLGKGGENQKIEKANEKEFISDEYQKLPTVETEKTEISTSTNSKISTECTASSAPSIKVISPNGGEVYNYGDKITVKWTKCNIPTGVDIGIDILNELKSNPLTVADNVAKEQTPNDGSETITLTEQKNLPKFIMGNKFKIRLNYGFTEKYTGPYKEDGHYPEWADKADESDNYFTINSATVKNESNVVTPTTLSSLSGDIKLLSFKAADGNFVVETDHFSENALIKVFAEPTGTGIGELDPMTTGAFLGTMKPSVDAEKVKWTLSGDSFKGKVTNNLHAVLYLNGNASKSIKFPKEGFLGYEDIFGENLKTYTNSDYGFSFNYPNSWKLSEDKYKKEVTVSTDDIAGGVDGRSYPSWSINFKATDKTYFTQQRVSTKMGIITYDEKLKALMSDSCLKAEQFFGSNPPYSNNTSTIQSIRYGGSLMSDPAYSNSAILTSNGEIIIVNSYQGVVITSELKSQLALIASSFKLLNDNTVFVPACAK